MVCHAGFSLEDAEAKPVVQVQYLEAASEVTDIRVMECFALLRRYWRQESP